MDYGKALNMLGSRDSRKIKNNTYLQRRGDDVAVRLHNTDVITFHSLDGGTTYNTGGWGTVTTKQRMNEYGLDGYRVFSDRGTLYVVKTWATNDPTKRIPFAETFTVEPDGSITSDITVP